MTRITFIDSSKAFAILLMIILHTTYAFPGLFEYVSAFHMALFYFVAGCFAKGKDVSIGKTVQRSINQIIIPYFAFSIIAFGYGWIYPYLHPDIYHISGGFADIFIKGLKGTFKMCDRVTQQSYLPCAALWFLASLFCCRILFSLWIHSSKRDFYIIRILIVGFLLTCYFDNISMFSLICTSVCFPYYVAGYYFRNNVINIHKDVSTWCVLSFAFLFMLCVYFLAGNSVMPDGGEIIGNVGLAYLRGFCGIFAVICLAIGIDKMNFRYLNSILSYIGTATLTILGLHLIGGIIFKVVFVSLGGPKEYIPLYYVIPISIVISLVCATIHHRFFAKKAPWIIGKANYIQ